MLLDHLILPLTKSPHPTGRVGPIEKQDWFRGLVKAKQLLKKFPGSKILVLSNVHVAGEEHEAHLYVQAPRKLGVADKDIVVVREAQETIEQVRIAQGWARNCAAQLIVVSTFLHYPRVRWLMRGMGATHYGVFGIPRPREAITDIILTFLFPTLDFLGARDWFLKKVQARRESGKH